LAKCSSNNCVSLTDCCRRQANPSN
jgi:hypothetical protein